MHRLPRSTTHKQKTENSEVVITIEYNQRRFDNIILVQRIFASKFTSGIILLFSVCVHILCLWVILACVLRWMFIFFYTLITPFILRKPLMTSLDLPYYHELVLHVKYRARLKLFQKKIWNFFFSHDLITHYMQALTSVPRISTLLT